jgi:predicted flap endonuclease-1-like 5' DNA nuclease
MPELNVTTITLLIVAVVLGVVVGWLVRGRRTVGEKAAISAGWQEQLEAQRTEHGRLMQQNKSLMEQNSQYQASNKDAKMRASELADALKEAFARRDELQRQIKEIRSNLELAVRQRDQLQNQASKGADAETLVRERDEQIEKLRRELDNWQERLPPLIERYRQRNAEAEQLEAELAEAKERIASLESMVDSDETRVEPVDPDALGDDLDASNEPIGDLPDPDESPDDIAHAEYAGAEDEAEQGGDETDASGEDEPEDDGFDDDDFDDDEPEADAREPEADTSFTGSIARDNLKLIKGVGPAIEKTLNEMGIFRLNQIAEMSEYDIDRVAHRLKGFRSRIYREDWMGQARELLTQKASG